MVLVVSFSYEEGFQSIYVGTVTGIGSFPGMFSFLFPGRHDFVLFIFLNLHFKFSIKLPYVVVCP